MSNLSRKLMMGAAGAAGGGEYIEDIFSTWLYDGNGSTQTITNGIDLSGEGGLVWIKHRSSGTISVANHYLSDTERGRSSYLSSSTNGAAQTASSTQGITSFNADGFSLGTDIGGATNYSSGTTYASWTFRKAPGFFDVVTYTGDGTAGRTVSHSLGSVPGCIIIKQTDASTNWQVYHRSLGNTDVTVLNQNWATATQSTYWNNTTPTSTEFTLGTNSNVNANGGTYVAYLFAHDEQIFGDAGDQSVVKCGNFTATSGTFVDLGWEPQWLLVKNTQSANDWAIVDTMRGITTGGNDPYLLANTSAAEVSSSDLFDVSATGFTCKFSASGNTYIYIAIRRGPMKTPTDATKVFKALAYSGNSQSTRTISGVGFPPDSLFLQIRNPSVNSPINYDRLRPPDTHLRSDQSGAEFSAAPYVPSLTMDGWTFGSVAAGANQFNNYTVAAVGWNFRRAPGFFDVVAYTGTSGTSTKTHSLAVAPELLIVKVRNASGSWYVYSSATGSQYLVLSSTSSATGSGTWTTPTSSVFTAFAGINDPNETYIAYLFATVSGVSKVGSYTGTGTTIDVDCGFTSGARFVLIKRTDSTGDWYVWDTARGIVAGNDPYLLLNSAAAENTSTDYIDPLSSGFQISSTAPAAINANGGSFIFLAIA